MKYFLFHVFVILLLSRIAFGDWRVQQTDVPDFTYSTRDLIGLKYLGGSSDFIAWNVLNGSCIFSNASSATTEVRFSQPGVYAIQPSTTTSDADIEYIAIKHSPFCYLWQSALSNRLDERLENETSRYVVQVWVADISASEDPGPAVSPSQRSMELSQQFYVLGERPILSVSISGSLRRADQPRYLGFNGDFSVWEFSVKEHRATESLVHYTVYGNALSLYSCFIRPTKVIIPSPSGEVTDAVASIPVLYSGLPRGILSDPCSQSLAFLFHGGRVLVTKDAFQSVENFTIDVSYFEQAISSFTIQYMASTPNALVVLGSDSSIVVVDKFNYTTFKLDLDEPFSGMNHRDTCTLGSADISNLLLQVDDIVLWSEDTVFVLNAVQDSAPRLFLRPSQLILQDLGFTATQRVVTWAELHPVLDLLAVVERVSDGSSNATAVSIYNLKHQTWQQGTILSNTGSFDFKLKFISSGKIRFLLWSTERLYSYDEVDGLVRLDDDYFSLNGDTIKYVDISRQGDILVQGTTNVLHHTSVTNPMLPLIHINSGEASNTEFLLWFNMLDAAHVVSRTNGVWGKRQMALRQGLHTATYPDTRCPYKDFLSPTHNRILYLDMRENVTSLQFSFTHSDNYAANLEYFVSGFNSTNVTPVQETIYPGNSQIDLVVNIESAFNVTLNISQIEYTQILAEASGTIGVEVWSNNSHVMCRRPLTAVTVVKVGCPRGRHVRVKKPVLEDMSYCDEYRNLTYTIPGDKIQAWKNDTDDVISEYDYESLGCPIKLHNSEQFVPELELYDEDIFVRKVDVNFIVWEEYARKGLSYNMTMAKIGCLQEALTWNKLRDWTNDSNVAEADLWGPWNHLDCFESPDFNYTNEELQQWLKKEYEILNRSALNHLKFPKDHDGVFILNVRVIEPGYSYCKLQTQFAVTTEGAILDADIAVMGLCLLIFIIAFLILLVATYFYLKTKMYGGDFEFHMEDDYDSD